MYLDFLIKFSKVILPPPVSIDSNVPVLYTLLENI